MLQPIQEQRYPCSQLGYITYEPDLERFEFVRKTVADMYRKKHIKSLSLTSIVYACQQGLTKSTKQTSSKSSRNSSSSSSRGSSSDNDMANVVEDFDEAEISGHISAIELEGTLFFMKKTGMVYQVGE